MRQLLSTAKDLDALVTSLPCLTDPALTISILVTVDKWYFNKRDPVEVIEADPELIVRAQVSISKEGWWGEGVTCFAFGGGGRGKWWGGNWREGGSGASCYPAWSSSLPQYNLPSIQHVQQSAA